MECIIRAPAGNQENGTASESLTSGFPPPAPGQISHRIVPSLLHGHPGSLRWFRSGIRQEPCSGASHCRWVRHNPIEGCSLTGMTASVPPPAGVDIREIIAMILYKGVLLESLNQ